MSEWKKVKLGDCIKEINEKTTKNNQYKVLSVTKDGIFSQEDFFKKQIASKNNIGYKIIRKNNLVFSTMNLWMGSLDVLTNYDIGIVSPAYKIFEFNEKLMLPEYGNYFMKSYYMLEQYKNCSEQGASVVRKNLDLKALLKINVIIPPIEEQEKVIKILKNVDEIIKKLIYEKTLINYQKKNYIKKLLDINKLKKIEWVKLKDISSNITKGTTPKKFTNKGVRFIKIEAINGENIDNEKCSFITQDEHAGYLKRSILEENDILFAIAGATIGKCAIVKKENLPANTNQALSIIRLKNKQDSKYIIKVLESNLMKKYISTNLTVGAQPNLNLEQIGNFKIPKLNKEEREKFLKVINLYEKKIMLINNKKEEYMILKKFLMQKLLIGKVKVNV